MDATDVGRARIRIRRCGYNMLPPGTVTGPVTANKYVLVWMDAGTCRIDLDGDILEISTRDLVLCPPGAEITYRWTDDSRVIGYVFFYATPNPRWRTTYHLSRDDIVPYLLRHILWLQREQPNNWVARADQTLTFALELLATGRAGSDLDQLPPVAEPIARAMVYIGKAWANQRLELLSLTDIAEYARVSPTHLSRLFTHELGHPPMLALRLLRLRRAATLLRETEMTIRDVAFHCGFSTEFHFSHTFKKWTKESPSTFRDSRTNVPALPYSLAPIALHLGGQLVEQKIPRRP